MKDLNLCYSFLWISQRADARLIYAFVFMTHIHQD